MYSTSGTLQSGAHIVIGPGTTAGGNNDFTVTFTGSAVFTSSTSYVCTANWAPASTNAAHVFQVNRISGTQE